MKAILIIGTGYLGRTIVGKLQSEGNIVFHTFNTQKQFSDSLHFDVFSDDISQVFSLEKIDTVIFTSHVEDCPDAQKVIDAMKKAFISCKNKRVIYLSTDAVFDGKKGMYTEKEIPNPTNMYGKNSRNCEELISKIVPNHVIIRPSYIYGYSLGKLDNRLSEAGNLLDKGIEVKKFTNMFKSPIEVNFLADSIIKISATDFRGVIHMGGKRMNIYEFFKQELTALGKNTSRLVPCTIPESELGKYLIDTSLDSSLVKMIF